VPDDDAAREQMPLGEWLRAARLRRGFSYAEIEHTTRINRLYLEALEDGHYDAIPAPVYVRGFLRSYARALGLDPEHAIALLPHDLPRPPGLEPSAAMRRPYGDAPAIAMPSLPSLRLPAMRTGGLRSALGAEATRWIAAAIGAAALILAAIYVPPILRGDDARLPDNTPNGESSGASGTFPAGAFGMPNLVGMTQEDAQRVLQEAGLTWVIVEAPSASTPAGRVERQTPGSGSVVRGGDNITLIVSRGAPQ
jgi:hypothetical protein